MQVPGASGKDVGGGRRGQEGSYKEQGFVRLSEMLRAEAGCLGEVSTQGKLAFISRRPRSH